MKLAEVQIKGFKSFDNIEGQAIEFGDITLLLGANGSGKSNLVSFFRLVGFLMTGALQDYVGRYGVSQLLYYGPKATETITFRLKLADDSVEDVYEARLSFGLPDRLFVSGEKVTHIPRDGKVRQDYQISQDSAEAQIGTDARKISQAIANLSRGIKAFQFHDTSDTARIKDRAYIDDAAYLRSDGGNLAAFLRMLKDNEEFQEYYNRIVRHIRRVVPQFHDFVLHTLPGNNRYVRLNWVDTVRPDHLFGPDQLSDGSLRFMALATLLLQPPALMPKIVVIDEPELGLHPAAIAELAGLMKRASVDSQIIVATQSTRLIDEFSPEQLVVVERDARSGASLFKRLDARALEEWLSRYSLSELWEKNVIGGQP